MSQSLSRWKPKAGSVLPIRPHLKDEAHTPALKRGYVKTLRIAIALRNPCLPDILICVYPVSCSLSVVLAAFADSQDHLILLVVRNGEILEELVSLGKLVLEFRPR